MLQSTRSLPGRRTVSATALFALLLVAGCNTTAHVDHMTTGSVPLDHRDRHPIRLTENVNAVQLLIGSGTGVLTADQRAQVSYLASTWRREGTGHLILETPRGTPNQRSAAYAAREVQSILRASGVPPRAVVTKTYQTHADALGPVRLAYARIEAEVGPCGTWPEDLGAGIYPSLSRMPSQYENRQYWNFGCSTQQNLAAMVSNPEDLVQPRASTPPYAARRQAVMEKYRKGENPSGEYETKDAQASEVAQ